MKSFTGSRAAVLAALLLATAAGSARAAAPQFAYEFESEAGPGVTGDAEVSAARHKSGARSLYWRRSRPDDALAFTDAKAFSRDGRGGVGFWVYNDSPGPGAVRCELRKAGVVTGAFRLRLDFRGWRPVVVAYEAAGCPAAPDGLTLRPVEGTPPGGLFLDALRLNLSPAEAGNARGGARLAPGPEGVVRPDTETAAPDRPWLAATLAPGVTPEELAAVARLRERLLPAAAVPAGKRPLPPEALEKLRARVAAWRIVDDGTRVTGAPLRTAELCPADAVGVWEYVALCDEVASLYARSPASPEAESLKRLFVTLCRHWLDQGMAAGGATLPFDNYPGRGGHGFAAMRGVLADAGLARPMALSLAWQFGHQGAGGYLAESPGASMDGLGFWCNRLPFYLLILPDDREAARAMRVTKRFYDLALVNPHTIGPDGACYHHGAFHFAYAAYNLPRLLTPLQAMSDTPYRLGADARQRLRTYAHAIAFTFSAGQQPYNLGARAGTPLSGDMGRFATLLAALGSPDGSRAYDPEMAALALSQYAELGERGAATLRNPPYAGWIADGVKPAVMTGHLVMNGAPIAVHRRPGWLVGIAGQGAFSRGLEIYGWTEQNNYARYARHGSVCVVSGGNPPSLAESGWRYDGWNWCHFPGTTALLRAPRELFEGYTMASNGNPMCGGTELEGDGVWGMDAAAGGAVRFKKTVFCFDDRITVVTTDIVSDHATAPAVTTLFQNALVAGGPGVVAEDGPLPAAPAERTLGGERPFWLIDNCGTGYLLPAGHDPVRIHLRRQEWLYMTSKYLKDPKVNPLKHADYRWWNGRKADMDKLESHYRPSAGDFATAYFEHGPAPKLPACEYTLLIRATPERMRALASAPPFRVLRRDASAHLLRDDASRTTACAVYGPVTFAAGAGALVSVDRPCLVMLRDREGGFAASVACPDLRRTAPVRLVLRGAWTAAGAGVTARVADGLTTLEVSPDSHLPARFTLSPAR